MSARTRSFAGRQQSVYSMSNEDPGDNLCPGNSLESAHPPRPYRLGRRGEAVDRNRTRMLEAAREILRSEGLPALTMEAVARRVGVSRQTVHNQFGSRIALLEALIDSAAISG